MEFHHIPILELHADGPGVHILLLFNPVVGTVPAGGLVGGVENLLSVPVVDTN